MSNARQMAAVSCEETGYYCYFEEFYLLLGESWELFALYYETSVMRFSAWVILGYLYFLPRLVVSACIEV